MPATTRIETERETADGSRIFTSKFLFRPVGSRIYGIYFVVTSQDIACSVRERE